MSKTILITGSTDGIGKLAAIKLAKDGHHIYVHGRNSQKLKSVIAEIKQVSNNQHISGFPANFSNLEDIRKLAEQVKTEISKLDILINNAGVYKSSNDTVKAGDIRFVVNYLAPFVLTKELFPILHKTDEPRVINLSSAAQSSVSLEALLGSEKLTANEAYAQSKLALTMWSFYLAEQQSDVSTIAVNPGSLLNTNMVKEAFGHHWSSADKGADILYELAISENHNSSGKYFDNDKGTYANAHPDAYNEKLVTALIEKTKTLVNR